MSVGLLLVTHGDIGSSLLDTAVVVLGACPLQTRTLGIPMACEPEQLQQQAQQYIEELDQGDGVLVLADLYGSTPSNIVCRLRTDNVAVINGLNLPMLIKVLNYPSLDLVSIAEKAVAGGRDGIVSCMPGAQ